MTLATMNAGAAQQSGSFVPAEILGKLGSLTREQADSCDFGVIRVDDSGKIQLYNKYESDMAGVPVHQAEGKSFFTQIAPCTNNSLFYGSFKKGVAASNLNVAFPYTFTYKMRPTNVNVHLVRDNASGTNWVFVKTS